MYRGGVDCVDLDGESADCERREVRRVTNKSTVVAGRKNRRIVAEYASAAPVARFLVPEQQLH